MNCDWCCLVLWSGDGHRYLQYLIYFINPNFWFYMKAERPVDKTCYLFTMVYVATEQMHIAAAGGGQTGSGIIHCQCQCPMKSVNISPHLGLEISTSPNSIFTHMKCVFMK